MAFGSSIGSAGDAVYVPILPSFNNFFDEMAKKAEKSGKDTGDKIARSIEAGVDKAQKAVDRSADAQERAWNRAADAAGKTQVAQAKLLEVQEKAGAKQSEIIKATQDYEKAKRDEESALRKAESATQAHEKAQQNLKVKTDEAANATKAGADVTDEYGRAASSADESSKNFEWSLGKVAVAAAAIGAAVGGAVKAAYDLGASFDDAYDTIRIGTGASGAAFEDLQDSLRNVAQNSIGVGSDLGEIGTTLADLNTRLGVTGEPLEKLTTQFQQLKGMGMEADVNAVTGAFTQFGIEAEKTPEALDTLFQISQATGREMNDLVNNLTKSGPALQEFGFGLTESAGLLGALDKAGLDADKTLGSMTKALSEFAKDGEDPQQSLWNMIKQIDELTRAGKGAEAIDLANSIFGAKGGAGFVAAVESGAFAYDDFMESIGASGDTIGGVAAETASFAEVWDQFKLRAMLALEPVATAVFNALVPALEKLSDVGAKAGDILKGLFDFLRNNQSWLLPLGAALMTVAAGIAAMAFQAKVAAAGGFIKWIIGATKATTAYSTATKIAAAAQKFFNTVLRANPIGMIVTAIMALVSALVVFFTKTEKGRELWGQFMDFIRDKLEAAKTWFSGFADGVRAAIQPLFDFFGKVKDSVAEIINILFKGEFTGGGKLFGLDDEGSFYLKYLFGLRDAAIAVWNGIKAGWDFLVNAFQWGWTNIIKPTFDALGAVAVWLWQTILVPAFTGIKLLWDALASAIQWAWTNLIQPTFQALGAAAMWLWNTVLVPAFNGIKVAWDILSLAIQRAWETIIKPTWDAIAAGATWLWQSALVPSFEGIKTAFKVLADAIKWAWETIIKPVWDGLAMVMQWLWENVVQVYIGLIKDAWTVLGQAFQWVWETLLRPAFDAVAQGARWLWENVLMPTFEAIKEGFAAVGRFFQWVWESIIRPAWDGLGAGIRWVVDNAVLPAFNAIRDGLERVKGWFQTAVDAIGRIWDKMKEVTATPIRFVVNTVWNDGLLKAVNAVVGFIGMDKLTPVNLSFARGGIMPGGQGILPGYTPGRDIYHFVDPTTGTTINLAGGEPILRPEAGRVLGSQWVHGVNAAARQGGERGVQRFLGGFAGGGFVPSRAGSLGSFAGGGIVDSIVAAVNKNFPMMTITSTYRNTADFHGAGKAVDFSNGTDTTPQMQSAARWFHANYGKGLLELIHWPLNGWQNIKYGAPKMYDAGTNAQHRNHVHVAAPGPLGDPTVMVEMLADGGGGFFEPLRAIVARTFKAISDPMLKLIPEFPGYVGRIPRAVAEWGRDKLLDFIQKRADEFQPAGGTAGNAESWREMAIAAMRRNGFNADDPAQVNAMLSQIMSESGGIPGRVQEIVDINGTGESAGVGLLQIIPGTFADHRDPTLPNDRKDPWANMNAALRYYKSRYGTDLTVMWGHGHGYARGGINEVVPGYSPGRDVWRFYEPETGMAIDLSGGEPILRPEAGRVLGSAWVDGINAAARMGGVKGVSKFLGSYANGGFVGSFANGGTYGAGARFWQPIGDQQRRVAAELNSNLRRLTDELIQTRNWNKFTDGVNSAIQPALRELEKIANPHTYEGIAARAVATQATEIVDMLGLKTTADVFTTALGAEKQLLDARAGYEARVAAIVDKERQLVEAREALADLEKNAPEISVKDQRKLADAEEALAKARKESEAATNASAKDADAKAKAEEKAKEKVADAEKKLARVREDLGIKEGETAEKRAEDLKKATESVSKAEAELVDARKASVRALDMLVFDVAPQINAGLIDASRQIRQHVPQAADALLALAAMAGPAGVSIGEVIESIKVAIQVVTKVIDLVDRIVGAVFAARVAAAEALHDSVSAMREFTDLVAKQQQMVADLQIQLVRAAIAQTKAAMDARNATAAMVRARLEGDRQVADARTALEVEIQAEMRRSRRDYRDLSLAYDRYRYGEYKAMEERLTWQMKLTPELAALQLEVDAAEMTRMANIQRATSEAIEASYAHRNAARAAHRASEDLNRAAEMLALMTGKTFGLDQTQAYVGQEVARLYSEKARLQGELSNVKNNLSAVWRWGGGKEGAEASLAAVNARIAELEARPEFAGFGVDQGEIDRVVKKAQTLYVFGREDDAKALFEGSALGDARRAVDAVKFEQGLASIKNEIRDMDRAREDLDDEVALEKKVRPLRDSAAALDSAASSAKYRAESLRAEDPAVAAALKTLADFERENAIDIQRVSRGEASRIELAFTDKAAYSAAEVDALLDRLGSLDGIELRVEKLEAAASPGPADLMRLRAR